MVQNVTVKSNGLREGTLQRQTMTVPQIEEAIKDLASAPSERAVTDLATVAGAEGSWPSVEEVLDAIDSVILAQIEASPSNLAGGVAHSVQE